MCAIAFETKPSPNRDLYDLGSTPLSEGQPPRLFQAPAESLQNSRARNGHARPNNACVVCIPARSDAGDMYLF